MPVEQSDPICPLCGRPIPPDVAQSRHHLMPRLKGGKGGETALLHAICHAEIHAALSEAELARTFATVVALRAHPRLASFIRWVAAGHRDSPRACRGRDGRRSGIEGRRPAA